MPHDEKYFRSNSNRCGSAADYRVRKWLQGFTMMLQDRAGNSPQYLAEQSQKFIAEASKRPEIAKVYTLFPFQCSAEKYRGGQRKS
jgi:hypothetical protein